MADSRVTRIESRFSKREADKMLPCAMRHNHAVSKSRMRRYNAEEDPQSGPSMIFPGFISQCGSRAFLMLLITPMVSRPSSLTRNSFLPSPMPCSPCIDQYLNCGNGLRETTHRARSVHFQGPVNHVVNALLDRRSLGRIGVVVEDALMEVAVAHMAQDARE